MLLAEARLAATLHHPNIVQVYDVGEEDGTYFFTMEYVFGQDLRKIVRTVQARGAWLSTELILQIIIGTAMGLHHAHEQEGSNGEPLGLVHRDVSPSNILVSHDGAVKLVDFGIARVSAMQSNTAQGVLKGKVPYMSPEQCRGEQLDRRSDIFSLGIMLWELTTRRRLFGGANDIVIAGKICSGEVPRPSSVVAGYPAELEAIVLKALAHDRDDRYATAQELQIDLEAYAHDARMLLSSAKLSSFMSDLFADQIKATKADIRHQIASRTGMFEIVDEDSGPGVPGPHQGHFAHADPTEPAPHELNHTVIERPRSQPRRHLWLPFAGGGAVLLALALALARGAPQAAPASAPTPPGPVLVTPPPVLVTPPPRTLPVVTQPPAPVPDPARIDIPPRPDAPTKKKPPGTKPPGKTKTPTNWDPDSPLPPP